MPTDDKPALRSATGMLALIVGLALYCFLVAGLGDFVAPFGLFAEVVYYLAAGIVWIFPAIRLIRWMNAGER